MKEDVVNKPRLIRGGAHIDDRGVVTFCNDFDMSEIKRWYMLENYEQGYVRAWHGHIKEAKWVVCVSGVAVEAAFPIHYLRWHTIAKELVPCTLLPCESLQQIVRDVFDELISNHYAINYDKFLLDHSKYLVFPEPDRFTLHPNGDVLYIPPGYANGHKNLTLGTRMIHFSNLAQDETVGDDVRFDSSIHGWVWEVKSR